MIRGNIIIHGTLAHTFRFRNVQETKWKRNPLILWNTVYITINEIDTVRYLQIL